MQSLDANHTIFFDVINLIIFLCYLESMTVIVIIICVALSWFLSIIFNACRRISIQPYVIRLIRHSYKSEGVDTVVNYDAIDDRGHSCSRDGCGGGCGGCSGGYNIGGVNEVCVFICIIIIPLLVLLAGVIITYVILDFCVRVAKSHCLYMYKISYLNVYDIKDYRHHIREIEYRIGQDPNYVDFTDRVDSVINI